MAVPSIEQMYCSFLKALADGDVRSIKEVRSTIADLLHLTEADLNEEQGGKNRASRFAYRVRWDKTYLEKAGLIETVQRGYYRITAEGKKVLAENPEMLNNNFLMRYKSFQEFVKRSDTIQGDTTEPSETNEDNSPDEILNRAIQQINVALADDLLSEVMAQPSGFFEWLVSHLLEKMGYGISELELSKTSHQSRDGGIDGIIRQDKLGFDKIYIQAKRWELQTPVGRPEIQKFCGALPIGLPHGLFITTARFTEDAQAYAKERNIVLVNGKRLAELMIEYNVGVSVETEYVVKKLDTDFFEDNLA